jgi:hypothetical protein
MTRAPRGKVLRRVLRTFVLDWSIKSIGARYGSLRRQNTVSRVVESGLGDGSFDSVNDAELVGVLSNEPLTLEGIATVILILIAAFADPEVIPRDSSSRGLRSWPIFMIAVKPALNQLVR